MISAVLFRKGGEFTGFRASGHSGYAEEGSDIVCAAVSSAVYMAANTLTDVCGCAADIHESDGDLALQVTETDVQKAQNVLQGLQMHLQGLSAQYPKFIKIQSTEV